MTMAIKTKKNGTYVDPVGIYVKKNGVYAAAQGVFAKAAGAYQSAMGAPVVQAIAGYNIGAPLTVGGNTYLVTDGDDFTSPLDIVAPGRPFGRYATSRTYMFTGNGNGPRCTTPGSTLKMYDVDPLHVGSNDAGRGVARGSWSDSMVQSGGRLSLKARAATAGEIGLFDPAANVTNIGSMISSPTSLVCMASSAITRVLIRTQRLAVGTSRSG
jgi:hypothetical protein